MKRRIIIIILSVILAALIALLIFDITVNKKFDTNTIARASIIIVGYIISLVKIITGTGTPAHRMYKTYEHAYADLIKGAFSAAEMGHNRKKLLMCIDLYNKSNYEQAINKLTALLKECKRRDDYCAVLTFIALSYSDMGEHDDFAIDNYLKALEYDDSRSTLWSNLGMLYKDIGDTVEAIKCYTEAIKCDKNNAYAYNNLADAYYTRGMYEDAEANAKTALEKNNKLYQSASLLCIIYTQLENTDEADRYFRIAVANGQNASTLRAAIENVKNDKCEEDA